jgi:hypothetical protein
MLIELVAFEARTLNNRNLFLLPRQEVHCFEKVGTRDSQGLDVPVIIMQHMNMHRLILPLRLSFPDLKEEEWRIEVPHTTLLVPDHDIDLEGVGSSSRAVRGSLENVVHFSDIGLLVEWRKTRWNNGV